MRPRRLSLRPSRIAVRLASALLAPPIAAALTDTPAPRPTIGLVLGSGGANGLVHIAILLGFDAEELRDLLEEWLVLQAMPSS